MQTPVRGVNFWSTSMNPLSYVHLPPIVLENGERLSEPVLAYQTFGELSPNKDNVVLAFHALSGNTGVNIEPNSATHCKVNGEQAKLGMELSQTSTHDQGSHPARIEHYTPWWGEVLTPERLKEENWFVICFNVLGSCYGSSGPYRHWNEKGTMFPEVTVKDQTDTIVKSLHALNIHKVFGVIGASLGGMLALETLIRYPKLSDNFWICATGPTATAEQIGWQSIQINAIINDPLFKNGTYSTTNPPNEGLALARKIAHMTYRNGNNLQQRFSNKPQQNPNLTGKEGNVPLFAIESYLNYQAEKFCERFDANTYLTLTNALNAHNIYESAGVNCFGEPVGTLDTLNENSNGKRVKIVTLSGDMLQPEREQMKLVQLFGNMENINVSHTKVETEAGHDGFLTEKAKTFESIKENLK